MSHRGIEGEPPTRFYFVCLVLGAALICLVNIEIFDFSSVWSSNSALARGLRGMAWAAVDTKKLSLSNGKKTKKWIVVTSVNYPSEDVKRLASVPEWTLVVVGDSKTPPDWKLPGVHFLSLETQRNMGLRSVSNLPTGSYTRKNAGYLYAIANGAEWIYDTDDDNKPYEPFCVEGKGLEQFDYEEIVSGFRFQQGDIPETGNASSILYRLFNPYRHFGALKSWPRGFPLEYYSEHIHRNGMYRVCKKMKIGAVQQGIVQKDPDVDAIYRLLNADPVTGLDERFNQFAPPVTLAPGTYAPWNSQNTLFHRRAFFGLFLPTSVAFRVTDIWRSFFTQKLLHLIDESVSFVPVNAIQIRNAHDYLKDFHQEIDVYEKTGELINFIDGWKCQYKGTVEGCVLELAKEFALRSFWSTEDHRLITMWIEDLKSIGYTFPPLRDPSDEYNTVFINGTNDNCRPAHIELKLDTPRNLNESAIERAKTKIDDYSDLYHWCKGGNASPNLPEFVFPSPEDVSENHAAIPAIQEKLETVLIITNNWPWSFAMGYQQRFYDGFFGMVIFCGTYDEENRNQRLDSRFPPVKGRVNYIYLSTKEMSRGFFGYLCMAKVKQMRLQNVKGYFMVADDTVFNIWQPLDLTIGHEHGRSLGWGPWWPRGVGRPAAMRVVELVNNKYKNDAAVQKAWKDYAEGLRYSNISSTAAEHFVKPDGHIVSDWAYLPASNLTYFATLAEVSYEAQFFHELFFSKIYYTIPNIRHPNTLFLWGDRGKWPLRYSPDLLCLHPVKPSQLSDRRGRSRVCSFIISVMQKELFRTNDTVVIEQ